MNCPRRISVSLALLGCGALPCASATAQTFSHNQFLNPSTTPLISKVLARDVDGDGRVDVTTMGRSNRQSGQTLVDGSVTLYTLQEDGSFSGGRELLRSGYAAGMDYGDLDGDGDLDLLAFTSDFFTTHELVRLENLGSGRFVERERFPAMHPEDRVWISDINSDGLQDALLATKQTNFANPQVWVRYGQGGGLLGPEQPVVTAPTEVASVLLIDVDRDGLDDVVFDTLLSQWPTVAARLAWVRQLPSGGFGPDQTILMAISSNMPLVAVDVDNDGAKDLVRFQGELEWLRNHPTGAFALRQTLVAGFEEVTALTVTDLEGDGDDDLLCHDRRSGGDRIRSVINNGGTFVEGERSQETMFRTYGGLAAIDVNDDGLLDPVWCSRDSGRHELSWSPRTPGVSFPFGTAISDLIAPANLAVGNFDGDGRVEALSLGQQVRYFDRAELGGFERSRHLAAPPVGADTPGRPAVADYDGDGVQDVAYTSALSLGGQDSLVLLMGSGTGLETARVQLFGGSGSGHPCAIDVDHDGDTDLVVPGRSPDALQVFDNDGLGNFTPAPSLAANVRAVSCLASDMDGDNLNDLIVHAQGTTGAVVYLYRANATGFEPPTIVASPADNLASLAVMDADGDALLDIVLALTQGSDSRTELFHQLAPGQFSPTGTVGNLLLANSPQYQDVVSGDFTGDALDDLAIRVGRELHIVRGLGQGSFGPPVILSEVAGSESEDVMAVDMDGDLDLDLFLTDPTNRTAHWFENQRQQGIAYCDSTPNSTEQIAQLEVSGSMAASQNSLLLTAHGLPSHSAGYFLVSTSAGFSTTYGGSEGNLCLGGPIGHYRRPGEVAFSGLIGRFTLQLDLTDTPGLSGTTTVIAGQVLHYQAWFRDRNLAGSTSNFTSAVRVTFQ